MTIYEPTGIYGTVGKDIPAMPNQRFYSGTSRIGTGITAGYKIANWLWKYHKSITKAGALGAGLGLSDYAKESTNVSANQYGKALRNPKRYYSRKRYGSKVGHGKCCCCSCIRK